MRTFLLTMVAVAVLGTTARADETRAWVKAIPDEATWANYSKTLNADAFGKFIIDVKSEDIYYIDVNLFELHADFVLGVLLKQAWSAENVREYNKNYEKVKPRFILGYITHHAKVDAWTFSFWEGDKIDPDGIARTKKRLDDTFFQAKGLRWRPDSPSQEKQIKAVEKKKIGVVTNDELYKKSDYQAFNVGKAVGTLHVVPVGTPYESLTYDRHDIVLLQESYPDITPVAGILATTFSTPLSHVNLRAGSWGIPNAGDKKARDKYKDLDGKVVYYEVREDGATLRLATEKEIADYETTKAAVKHVSLPQANLTNPRFAMLDRIRAKDVIVYGTKTSNLGEIVTAGLDGVNVPEGFGVPFFYYVRHLEQNGLGARVDAMLADERFGVDKAWSKTALEAMRKEIVAAPIDPVVLDAVYKRVRLKLGGRGVFVRSSTNAEDLPGFNGAGLYDTVPNVKGKKALGEAIKTVWASVWNLRAVEERSAFGIDHRQVFPSVMVQIGVNATAAGVLVSTNLWDRRDDDGFTINAKWGLGMKVVEGEKVPEQIIFDATNDGTKIISRSDETTMLKFDENGGMIEVPVESAAVILTEERAKALVGQVQKIIPLFPRTAPLDVEWVLEGETMWIVQARPFVGK